MHSEWIVRDVRRDVGANDWRHRRGEKVGRRRIRVGGRRVRLFERRRADVRPSSHSVRLVGAYDRCGRRELHGPLAAAVAVVATAAARRERVLLQQYGQRDEVCTHTHTHIHQ